MLGGILKMPFSSSTASAIPHITTTGTHYQVGLDIGQTFKDRIVDFYKLHPLLHSQFIPWSQTKKGQDILQGYQHVCELNYPQYMNELRGISAGAGVPFLQAFMLTYQMEIAALLNEAKVPPECSDVYVNDPATKFVTIGHTEDTLSIIKDRGYLVTAQINDATSYPGARQVPQTESFTHYSYPGLLPGNAFGFNSNGLIQTVNAIYPKNVLTNRTGRYILTRALLSAKNLDDVARIVADDGVGCAYGVSVNIGLLPNPSTGVKSTEIWNFELAPDATQHKTMINAYQVLSKTGGGGGFGFHVNKYERMKEPERPDKVTSSVHRAARILELGAPSNYSALKDILGDTKDKAYPIYRTPSATDSGCTVATAIFDLIQQKVDVYKENPKDSDIVLSLPLNRRTVIGE